MLSPWYSSVGVDDNLVLVLVLVAAAQIPAVNVFEFPYTDTDEYHTIVKKRKHESAKKRRSERDIIFFSRNPAGAAITLLTMKSVAQGRFIR